MIPFIYFPFKPYRITQRWGNPNPSYSSQFNDPQFLLHNGVDANVGGNPKTGWPVYCPVAGFRVSEVAYYPNGGGHQIGLVSKEKHQIFDQFCYVSILLCHAEKVLVDVGYEPALGELIMVADNTGFSTGPHTHFGMYRLTDTLEKIDTNKATGSFDPSLFFTNEYAIDKASLNTLIKSNWRYYQYLLLYLLVD